jgi:hypothetical protein
MTAMRPKRGTAPAALVRQLDDRKITRRAITMDGVKTRMSVSLRRPLRRSSRLVWSGRLQVGT